MVSIEFIRLVLLTIVQCDVSTGSPASVRSRPDPTAASRHAEALKNLIAETRFFRQARCSQSIDLPLEDYFQF
jgi:hypothetical protein